MRRLTRSVYVLLCILGGIIVAACVSQFGDNGTQLENAIIITDQDCSALGPGWEPYRIMDGRFPVGSGQGTDINGTSLVFDRDQQGGEYSHTLTLEEMPVHTHKHVRGVSHPRRCSGDCSARVGEEKGTTEPTGDGLPHNNLPPYSVINFCKFGGI